MENDIPIIENPSIREVTSLFESLKSEEKGLSHREAKQRLLFFGPNQIPESARRSILVLTLKQFKSGLVLILLVAAAISWWAGEMIDAWVIIVVILINASIGFFQEYRAEKAIDALRDMIVKISKVYRDGQLLKIPSIELVPGDVIFLEEGDHIPADARIIEANHLRTIESALTGESLPVSKSVKVVEDNCPIADRKNMLWKGCFVAGGSAKALVTGTGIHTAIGDVSQLLMKIKKKRSNFLVKTDILARQMAIISILSAICLFLLAYFIWNFDIQEVILISIAALVAALPEGLPAVLAIVLAIGANRMAKRNALIREFSATETLGAVSAILTDKTGTLTQNILSVRKVFLPFSQTYDVIGEGYFPVGNFIKEGMIIDAVKNADLQFVLRIAGLSNNAAIIRSKDKDGYELIGDPTEGALLVLAKKGGFDPSSEEKKKVDDLPFDSNLKLRASLIHKTKDEHMLLVSGAPEELLKRSLKYRCNGMELELSKEDKERIQQCITDWSDEALRVIGLAYKTTKDTEINPNEIEELVFAGLAGMADPPRPEAKEAVEKCKQAGIRVIMVTGDHVNTAVAIANQVGILDGNTDRVLTALSERQLNGLDELEFREAVKSVSVFARLSPTMKLKIAEELQAMGHLIAMTGDGINDAPALKKADVGISMGIMGTDVARESSDVVLADDHFASIVNAVEEGRIIFNNSRKTGIFLVTTNIAESVTLIISIALGLPLPLTATQLLWLNLVTDGVNDMALATEAGHGDIMKQKVFSKEEQILNRKMLPFLLINVVLMTSLSLASFYYYIDMGIEKARTGVFMVMSFTQLFNVFNLRSVNFSIFKIGVFTNRYINVAMLVSLLLLFLVTELPSLSTIFQFHALALEDIIVLFLVSSSVLWAAEIYKLVK